MAKKREKFYPGEAEHRRYMAMVELCKTKRTRTVGDLLDLRRRVMADANAAMAVRDEVLDRVYRGQTAPPDTGRWVSNPLYRTLYCTPPWGGGKLIATEYRWAHSGHFRRSYWMRAVSERWYSGKDDLDLLRNLVGRVPQTDLDKLVAAHEFEERMAENDEQLALEAVETGHRVNQIWQRYGLVKAELHHAIVKLMTEREDWAGGCAEPWRRIKFEDGTVITLTDNGDIVFDDTIVAVQMSLADPAEKMHKTFGGSIADRQRRARERSK